MLAHLIMTFIATKVSYESSRLSVCSVNGRRTIIKMAADLSILKQKADSIIFIEGLKNILECPVCLVPPTSTPIYRCYNGHILCNACRSKANFCPEKFCRIAFGNLRCLTSEKIAMLLKVLLKSYSNKILA